MLLEIAFRWPHVAAAVIAITAFASAQTQAPPPGVQEAIDAKHDL